MNFSGQSHKLDGGLGPCNPRVERARSGPARVFRDHVQVQCGDHEGEYQRVVVERRGSRMEESRFDLGRLKFSMDENDWTYWEINLIQNFFIISIKINQLHDESISIGQRLIIANKIYKSVYIYILFIIICYSNIKYTILYIPYTLQTQTL